MPTAIGPTAAADPAFATPNANSPTPSIAIIGGGITGLLFGLALHTHCPHLPFLIYEAASSFGEIGAGVGFSPNASRAMRLISPELHSAFEELRTPNKWEAKRETWFDLRLGEDVGETVEESGPGHEDCKGASVGGKRVREGDFIGSIDLGETRGGVHRAHFVDAVQKLMPQGTARFGKRLVDVSQDHDGLYVLTFSDTTTAQASSIVACDGIKSRCRQVLLGDTHSAAKARYTGKYCYRGLVPMPIAVAALGEEEATNSQMYWMQHKHLLTFPIANGKTMNVVAFASKEEWKSEKWIIEASREEMYKDYEGCGKKVKTILQMMQQPDIWALFEHKDAETYCKGGMCLIGDAAHASTPHQGAGTLSFYAGLGSCPYGHS